MSIAQPQTDSRQTQTTNFSIYPVKGWLVTPDAPLNGETPVFSQLTVETSGSVIVTTGIDPVTQQPNLRYFPLMAAGAIYPAAGIGVVLGPVTISGQSVSTTATGIWAHGGL